MLAERDVDPCDLSCKTCCCRRTHWPEEQVPIDERCEELAAGLCELELCCMYKKKGNLKVQNKTSEWVYETCLYFVACNYREWYLIRAQYIVVALWKLLQYRSIIVAIILINSQLSILEKSIGFLKDGEFRIFLWGKKTNPNNQPINQPTNE